MNLPPVMVPFVADLTKLASSLTQVQRLVAQIKPVTIPVQVQMQNANTQIGQLTAQMNALKQAMKDTADQSGSSRTQIAGLTAENVKLRQEISQTVAGLRAKGMALKDTAQFTQQLRTQLQANTQAIATERLALAQSTEATRQNRQALADVRAELAAAQKAYNDLSKAAAQAAKDQQQQTKASKESGGGGFLGGLASRAVGSSLNYGVAFGAGAAVGTEIFKTLTTTVNAATGAIIGFNASLEQSRVAFTTFLGSSEKADQFLQQLQQFAVKTPFEFPDLVEASKRMLAFGFSAQQVLPLLEAVGNQASAVGLGADGVNRITLALGQMQAKGHVSGEELRQLSEAGVQLQPIFEEVGNQLGTTTAAAQKLGSDGSLSAQIFIQAFQKVSENKFGDLMAKQSQTFNGAMSNIKDALTIVTAQIGGPLFKAISELAIRFANFLQTPQFAIWAKQATQAIGSVIQFLTILLAALGKVVQALTGWKLPEVTQEQMKAWNDAQQQTVETQQQVSSSIADTTAQLVQASNHQTEIEASLAHQKELIDANKDAQEAQNQKIQDTAQGYDDIISSLERQIADIERLTPADIANKVQQAQIDQQIIEIKIAMPDTTALENTLRSLQRAKEDLGTFDSSKWDVPLQNLRDQIDEISNRDTKDLDDAIRRVQDNISQLGQATTDEIDNQIAAIRRNIDAISDDSIKAIDKQIAAINDQISSLNTDELDRKISDIQAKLNAPEQDYTGINSQLAAQAALIQSGAGDSAQAAFAGLSRQKQQMVDATRQQQTGLKAQLAALEAERNAQKQYNDDTKSALEGQLKVFQQQKQALQDANDAQKSMYEDQIKQLEEVKRQQEQAQKAQKKALDDELKALQERKRLVDEQNAAEKKAADEQVRQLEKEKKAAQDAFQAQQQNLEKQIQATQRQIQDAKQPAEDQIAALQRQKEALDLQQQQRDLARQIQEIPLKQKLEDEKRAREDALKPLQADLETLQRKGKELDSQNRKLDIERQKELDHIQKLQQDLANAGGGAGGGGLPGPATLFKNFDVPVEQTPFGKFMDSATQKLKELIESDEWSVIFYGKHKDGTPVSTGERWSTAGQLLIEGLNGLEGQLKKWVKEHDQSGDWVTLLWGENPDGTRAGIMKQFGALNELIDTWLQKNGAKWLTDWGEIGKGLRKAWDGPDSFNWGSIDRFLDNIVKGIDKWFSDNTPKWMHSWTALGHDLRMIWDGPDGFNWGTVGDFFGKINEGITHWLQDHGPKWLTSWDELGKNLKSSWSGPDSFNWGSIGTWFTGISDGVNAWATEHLPSWLTDWTKLGTDLKSAWAGPDSFNWTAISTFFTDIYNGIEKWISDNFDPWLTKFETFAHGIANAFSNLGTEIAEKFKGPLDVINNFFKAIGDAVHWLASHFPGVKDIEPFQPTTVTVGGSSGGGGGQGAGYAEGVVNSPKPGHWAIVGEKGPEPMYVPKGATIIPNDKAKQWGMLPGHAEGLNFDFLGGVLGTIGKFIRGSADKAVTAIMDKVGTPDIGIIPGLGGALFDMTKNALLAFLRPQEVVEQLAAAAGGGALAPLIGLIRKYAQKYNVPPEIIGAIILHESGGIIGRVEVGGGKGRGLMQVDGGTWPQAYDPRMVGTSLEDADFQIDVGSMILGRAFEAANGDVERALTNYAGGGFAGVHGRTFYKELQDMGLIAQALAALAGPDLGNIPAGAFIKPVNGPITQEFGHTGFYLEPGGFHDGVDFGVPTGTPVMADQSGNVIVAGWDNGWGIRVLIDHLNGIQTWMAHNQEALVSVGESVRQGQVVAHSDNTGASTGPHVHWGAHVNGKPFNPLDLPGLARGGYISQPMMAVVGEGPEPEIISPDSKLRQIVREESGGVSVHFEDGAISVDASGRARVDASKITVRKELNRSAAAKGILTGVG